LISFRLFELIIDPYFSSEFENAIIIILDPFLEVDFKKKKHIQTGTANKQNQNKTKKGNGTFFFVLKEAMLCNWFKS